MKINNYLILYFLLISLIFNAKVKNNLDDEDEDNIQTPKKISECYNCRCW